MPWTKSNAIKQKLIWLVTQTNLQILCHCKIAGFTHDFKKDKYDLFSAIAGIIFSSL
jgi:hypothetical protein